MPVLEHARTAQPADYTSDNHRKWSFDNRLYQRHLELYLDRLSFYLKQTGADRILDVGCGEGIVYRAMRERGAVGAWTGFDFSDVAVAFARQASPEAHWLHASAYTIPFRDRHFGLVLSSQVFEHLPNPDGPLRECARVSQGWLLLSVPLEPWFRALTWISVKTGLGRDPGHVNHWTGKAFREFLQKVGRVQAWERTTVYQIALVEV